MAISDIQELRRRNLDAIVGEHGMRGRIARFARKYDLDPSYISQVLNGHRPIAERSARNFEEKIGLPPYHLDKEHHQIEHPPTAYSTDPDTKARLEAIIQQLSDEDRERAIRILEAAFAAAAKEEKPES